MLLGCPVLNFWLKACLVVKGLEKKTWLNHNITFDACRDCRPIAALDVYDAAGLDDEEFDEMDPEARREAERLMRKRDREEAATRGRLHRGLLYGTCMRFFFCSKGILF